MLWIGTIKLTDVSVNTYFNTFQISNLREKKCPIFIKNNGNTIDLAVI